ncbi:glycosyl hydrolase 2 galactose-binding domain-containing protein [Williamsia sp. R60]
MSPITGWKLLGTTPGAAMTSEEVQDLWPDAVDVEDATVVGAVDQALSRWGDNVDASDWWFTTTIETAQDSWIDFAGVTAPATVYLDDRPVAEVESMFLPVSVAVPAGDNRLVVHFPALDAVLRKRRPRGRWRSSLVAAQGFRWLRTTLIGRAPVYSGVSPAVGFWRPVALRDLGRARDVVVQADPRSGRVTVNGVAPSPGDVSMSVRHKGTELTVGAATADSDGQFTVSATVPEPALWWPRGYGDQSLYTAIVTMAGQPLCENDFGFRTVEMTSAHEHSGSQGFSIAVNGIDIFCRGAVWMPPDPLRLTSPSATTQKHLQLLADAGTTMLRVPGGTVFPDAEFWSYCADLGILVWQDTMQATFDPPEDVQDLLCAEMRELLRTVSGNPALAVVSGGNELIQQPEMLGLAAEQRDVSALSRALSLVVAAESDAVFVVASPSSPPGSTDLAIRPDSGVTHWFGVGGYLRPLADVKTAGVRFAAESLAFAIPPSADAVDRHFSGAAVAGHDPRWKSGVPRDRGASWDFEDVRDHYVAEVFDVDPLMVRRTDPERYLQLGRLAVAEAMLECYAFWRRHDSGCDGALVLSSKDLCAGAGWGLIDIDGQPKAPLQALARLWSPVAVRLASAGLSGVRIDVYNDQPDPLEGTIELIATNSSGHPVTEARRPVSVDAHSSTTLRDSDLSGRFTDLAHAYGFGEPVADAVQATLIVKDVVVARDVHVIRSTAHQGIIELDAKAVLADGRWWLELLSRTTLRYVEVDVPGWRPADNYFHLAAGLPYRVLLTASRDHPGRPPKGSVTSIDTPTVTRFAADVR